MIPWKEYHTNGQLWIDGQIKEVTKNPELYEVRTGFKGYEGRNMVRVGVWKKYYDNGQMAWQVDYGNGLVGEAKAIGHQYRPDGSIIQV